MRFINRVAFILGYTEEETYHRTLRDMMDAYEAWVDVEKARLYPLLAIQIDPKKKNHLPNAGRVPFHINHGKKEKKVKKFSRIYKIDGGSN